MASAEDSIPQPLDPSWIKQQIDTHGAKNLVDRLWNQNRYEDVVRKIESGKPDWIALSPELAQGTDAATSEELSIALATALPLNTQSVLAVLNPSAPPLNPDNVCGAPFIEDSKENLPHYLQRAIKAVQHVHSSLLKAQKTACLAILKKTAADLQEKSISPPE